MTMIDRADGCDEDGAGRGHSGVVEQVEVKVATKTITGPARSRWTIIGLIWSGAVLLVAI